MASRRNNFWVGLWWISDWKKEKKRWKIGNWVDRENMSPGDKGLPYKDALWLSKSQYIQTVPSAAFPNSADACSNSQAKYLRVMFSLLLTAHVQLIRGPIGSTSKYFQTKPPQTSLTLIAAVSLLKNLILTLPLLQSILNKKAGWRLFLF